MQRDGVQVRLGVRAVRARPAGDPVEPDRVELDDGSTAAGHAVLLAVGRTIPLGSLGLETVGVEAGSVPHDGRLRLQDGLYLAGDCAGPELHTHQAHYQGELAVRMALGENVAPDYRALPRATYTDPELASVGVTLEEARTAGLDAFEVVADFPTTAKGYSVEAAFGHVTIVVDRGSRAAGRGGDGGARRLGRDPRVRARDQGARPGRRPRRHDPRVPVDVEDPQRAVRRGRPDAGDAGDGARRLIRPATGSRCVSAARGSGPAPGQAPSASTGSPAAAHASKPPITSPTLVNPRSRSVAAARLDE